MGRARSLLASQRKSRKAFLNLLKWFWYTPENGLEKGFTLVTRKQNKIRDKPRCEFEVFYWFFFVICEMDVLISMIKGNLALVQVSCSHPKHKDWKISIHFCDCFKKHFKMLPQNPQSCSSQGMKKVQMMKTLFWVCTKYEILISDGKKSHCENNINNHNNKVIIF